MPREFGSGGGSRLDVKPYISLPLEGASWFFKPTLAWRYTAYQVDADYAAATRVARSPTRSVPIGSIDTGLYFDRAATIDGRPYLHTLEPRLFYLNAPYRNQDDLPVFDTGALTFSWGQLFRDNRYSGADRQADANQLTLALTTRLMREADGKERLSASIGQIRYFDDSRVVLPRERPIEQGRSAWVADVGWAPSDRWNLGASYQWNPKEREKDLPACARRYLLPDDGIVNLAYRFRRDDLLEQADFSFLYPINPTWSVVGRLLLLDRRQQAAGADPRRPVGQLLPRRSALSGGATCAIAKAISAEASCWSSNSKASARPARTRARRCAVLSLATIATICTWCRRKPPLASPLTTRIPRHDPNVSFRRPSSGRCLRRRARAGALCVRPVAACRSTASVAVVDEDVILRSELDRAVANIRRQYAGRPDQLPPRDVLERQVLERLVLIQAAGRARRGLRHPRRATRKSTAPSPHRPAEQPHRRAAARAGGTQTAVRATSSAARSATRS